MRRIESKERYEEFVLGKKKRVKYPENEKFIQQHNRNTMMEKTTLQLIRKVENNNNKKPANKIESRPGYLMSSRILKKRPSAKIKQPKNQQQQNNNKKQI